ncbi:MAG: hypothetical protein ACT4OY_06200 [Alphaproteobacteria bacterium]
MMTTKKKIIIALAILIPVLLFAAAGLGKETAFSQIMFLILFGLMILCGIGFIRLVQKYY